jgi:hypothetical protein
MNENNQSFYPLDIFEFIHHPKYRCHDLKGLNCEVWLPSFLEGPAQCPSAVLLMGASYYGRGVVRTLNKLPSRGKVEAH